MARPARAPKHPFFGAFPRQSASHEAYLRTLIDAVPAVILAQDTGGRICMANRATADVLGMEVESLIGRLHHDVSPRKDDVALLQEQIDEVLETGESNQVERAITHPLSGEQRWFQTRVVPLYPPDGGPVQALVVGTDVTDHRRAEIALRIAQEETLERLARAAEYRDDDTGQHTRRVGILASALARLLGSDPCEIDLIRKAAPLHDLGKIGIPDAILSKPGPLSEEEFAVMKRHTLIGAALLAGGDSEVMRLAEEVALCHHEKWDGTGYPMGLGGDESSRAARVVALADVVDALSHSRPYRPAWPLERVIDHVRGSRKKHFDPIAADACLELLNSDGLSWVRAEASATQAPGAPAPDIPRHS
jgi:putative two-component system response regulator